MLRRVFYEEGKRYTQTMVENIKRLNKIHKQWMMKKHK